MLLPIVPARLNNVWKLDERVSFTFDRKGTFKIKEREQRLVGGRMAWMEGQDETNNTKISRNKIKVCV